ncbi:MAG: hypothetical protein ACYDAK_12990 [Candidatus Limnocylindrales bacterium]
MSFLAGLFRYEPIVAEAWIALEGQAIPNPSNPLNILSGSIAGGEIGSLGGRFAIYPSAADGLTAAYRIVSDLAPMYGYGLMLHEAGSGDAPAQAHAIEASSWAAGHYGLDGHPRGGIGAYVASHIANAPRGLDPMLNLAGYPLTVTLSAGQALYEHPGDTVPLVHVSGTAPVAVQAIGRAKEPGGGWRLVHVNTAAGWSDGVTRPTALYAFIP